MVFWAQLTRATDLLVAQLRTFFHPTPCLSKNCGQYYRFSIFRQEEIAAAVCRHLQNDL
jgi:hypothetical protein